MAHYARIDGNGVVQQVIVVANNECLDQDGRENEEIGAAFCRRLLGGTWVKTSYNSAIRGKFAGIGDIYDPHTDTFKSQ